MYTKVSSNFLKKILNFVPIITIIFFIFIDSVPFYFLSDTLFKTQLGLISTYVWICLDFEKTRPILLVLLGILIDLFGHFIFGISSLIFIILFFLQRKNSEILYSQNFKKTWLNFNIFLIIYNLIYCFLLFFIMSNIMFNFAQIIISMIVSILFFPLMFLLINYLNEKMRSIDE